MSVAFHRGLTTELRMKLQLTGLRIEEIDAQRALAGKLTASKDGLLNETAIWVAEAVSEVLDNHLDLQKEWEERNPAQDPFPPVFAEVVMEMLHAIDPDNPMETITKLIELAEGELMFG